MIGLLTLIQRSSLTERLCQTNIPDFDLLIHESVWKGIFFLFPNAVVAFTDVGGIEGLIATTRNSPLFSVLAFIRASEIDWNSSVFLGWLCHDYKP